MTDTRNHQRLEKQASRRADEASSAYLRAVFKRIAKRHERSAEQNDPAD